MRSWLLLCSFDSVSVGNSMRFQLLPPACTAGESHMLSETSRFYSRSQVGVLGEAEGVGILCLGLLP